MRRSPGTATSLRCSQQSVRPEPVEGCVTRYVRCAHCARTDATSQFTKRAVARGLKTCAPRRLTGAPVGGPASALRAPAVACARSRTTTVSARPRAGQRRGSDATPRCAGCAAVLRLVAPLRNFRRSLRSLWSDRRNESDHEARCARRPQGCAPRRRTLTPAQAGPQPCRADSALPASNLTLVPARPRLGCRRARLCGDAERRACGRARQRVSSTDSLRLSERSERSERSELRNGPQDRAPQCSRRAAATASPKRPVAAQPRTCPRGLSWVFW